MKINELQVDDVKRVSSVTIRPTSNLVEISGRNRQGKSSLLDSILWALDGADHIQAQPIRKGADKATIRLDLGEVIVTRKFRKTKPKKEGAAPEIVSEVIVEAASGARFNKPQQMLDSFLGALTFDPFAFTKEKPADQFKQLRRFVPGVDFAAIDGQNLRDYEQRTEANRDARNTRAAADAIAIPEGTPEAPIDEAALVQQLATAGEHNAQVTAAKAALQGNRERIEALRHDAAGTRDGITARLAEIEANAARRIASLEAEIAEVRRLAEIEKTTTKDRSETTADNIEAEAAELEQELPALEQRAAAVTIDVAALQEQINQARATNANVREAARKAELERKAKQFEDRAQALTDAIAARDKQKAEAIAAAQMPVSGLGFATDDKGQPYITFNGLPFDQASDAEQLTVSIAIAMAQNPKLRVIRVRDGNPLDAEAMATLEKIADQYDCQVWIETVRSDGRMAFVIEDGRLKDAPAEDADPAPVNNQLL